MIVIILLFLIFPFCMKAQGTIAIGERGTIALGINQQDSITYSVHLSNPTVFYIDSINIDDAQQSFQRITTDSITFIGTGIGNLSIHGIALAGSDSMTIVNVRGRLKDVILLDTSFVITITSNTTPLPYIRFSYVSENIPNPIMRGEATEWTYELDKPGSIQFSIITLDGRIIEEFSLMQDKGRHVFRFVPNSYTYHPGVYGMRLITEQGVHYRIWNVSP
ncbi:MAG: hypothetical protein EBU66_02860 [Bacteroidetes bacterium]|nr:hypothetical protein [bacterium]NBP63611.1 hypothetical protein [Bacteroidota bacterium]